MIQKKIKMPEEETKVDQMRLKEKVTYWDRIKNI